MLFSACAKRQILLPIAPVVGPVTLDDLKSRAFFGGIEGLRSEVSMSVYRDKKKLGSFGGALAYMSPNSLRLRGYDPFGLTILDMVIEGGRVQAILPAAYTAFVGDFDILAMPENADYRMEADASGYALYVSGGGMASRVYKYDAYLRNTSIDVAGERMSAHIVFGDFSGGLPLSIAVSLSNGYSLRVELENVEVDSGLDEDIFFPIDLQGVRVLPLELLLSPETERLLRGY